MKTNKELFTKYKYIAIVVFFSAIAVLDLLNFGIPPTHDAEYHVLRFQQFYKVLGEGTLYPRWAPDFNNGYGIPLFNYVYPLPNYLASIFHVMGASLIESFKLVMAVSTIVGAIFFYLWTRRFWGQTGGVVSSVFYTFAPYHLVDIYVRGSVGEVVALGIFPAVMWSYQEFIDKKKVKFFITTCIFLGLLVLSHNILAVMFFGLFMLYALFLTKVDFKKLFLMIFIGLGLSAPFWFPALLETKYVSGLQIFDITENFPKISKFFVPTWGFGLSPNDPLNPMSVQIGYANLLVILVSALMLFRNANRKIYAVFLGVFFIVFYLMTSYSTWIWQNAPLLPYFQFPWRLLSIEIVICSFLAGGLVSDKLFKKGKIKLFVASLMILLSVGLSVHYIKAPFYHKRGDQHYLTRANFTDGTNSPGNAFNTKWLNSLPQKREDKIEVVSGQASMAVNETRSLSYRLYVDAKTKTEIVINTAYFPGWKAHVNGFEAPILNKNGRMAVTLSKGRHTVRIWFDSTFAQKISYLYFLTSILLIILVYENSARRKPGK